MPRLVELCGEARHLRTQLHRINQYGGMTTAHESKTHTVTSYAHNTACRWSTQTSGQQHCLSWRAAAARSDGGLDARYAHAASLPRVAANTHACTDAHTTPYRTQARLFSTARRLVPIADRVLVKRVEHKTQTAGGIYLPTEQKVNEADVVAVGPGAMDESGKLIPMEVAVGDSVLLPEYGATAVNIGEEEFHLLRASDILSKFEG